MIPPSPAPPAVPPPPPPVPTNAACRDTVAPAIPAARRTFYIDAETGNDQANGLTPRTAWRSLAKANNAAQPGDLFLLNGTFKKQLIHPGQSGTPTAKIVYRALAGGSAVIDGGQYDVIAWLDGVSHVVVDGLELRNEAEPVVIRTGSNNIWLRNLYIHDAGSSAIHLVNASDNRIEDSRIERVGSEDRNAGEGIFIQDGSHRNAIVRNTIRDAGHGVLWISYQNGAEATSDDNLIERNDLSNPWAAGLGLNGKAHRTIVQCNRIHDTADGSSVNYARPGIEVEGHGNLVRFNEVFRTGAQGVSIQGRALFGFTQNATSNRIYNNTFWQNGQRKTGGGLGSLQLIQMQMGSVRGNVIENNIFWHDQGFSFENASYAITADLYHAVVPWVPGTANTNIVRNNVFPSAQTLLLVIRSDAANEILTLQRAQATLTGWTGNVQTDPLFIDESAGDVHLRDESVALRMGAGAHCADRCIVH